MSRAIENLMAAQKRAVAERPKVNGFPYLAEILRKAGVSHNVWSLPSCQSVYFMQEGAVVVQETPLLSGPVEVPTFNSEAVIAALRADQAGISTFPQFLNAAWCAGVVRFDVDFIERRVTYFGCFGEEYIESYPAVEVKS